MLPPSILGGFQSSVTDDSVKFETFRGPWGAEGTSGKNYLNVFVIKLFKLKTKKIISIMERLLLLKFYKVLEKMALNINKVLKF